jgi:hypothetical protein
MGAFNKKELFRVKKKIYIKMMELSLHLEQGHRIEVYNQRFNGDVEEFRQKTLNEGNESLIQDKFNPEKIDGQILLYFFQDELVSLSVAEASHYTGDPQIACRICRYHILERFRSRFLFCGFKMLKVHTDWAKKNGFKVAYWTHNVENRALNYLYQKKRKYSLGADQKWFQDPAFMSYQVNKDYLFKVTEKSDMLQFIYNSVLVDGFQWQPKTNVVPMEKNYLSKYYLDS